MQDASEFPIPLIYKEKLEKSMNSRQFFSILWQQYTYVTPLATRIYSLFSEANQGIINDHVAFRTFDLYPLNIENLEPFILGLGYVFFDDYNFPNKHLYAKSYIAKDAKLPKIFISQLQTDKLTAKNQQFVQSMCQGIEKSEVSSIAVLTRGLLWNKPSWLQYQSLMAESEYAAWLSVMGLRANHFTISVNHLSNYQSIKQVNRFLKENGFILNTAGGEIKGSPHECLEQSSTMADKVDFQFSGGDFHQVNSCYYEFALRYPVSNGDLFQGFVTRSADKIFESTFEKPIGA